MPKYLDSSMEMMCLCYWQKKNIQIAFAKTENVTALYTL